MLASPSRDEHRSTSAAGSICTRRALTGFEGVAYLARGTVHTPAGVKKTEKQLRAALETQRRGLGFSLVEIVTMCPTGWFVTPGEGPKFQQENLLPVFPVGELKRPRGLTA